jgi:serine O-acetyltransferase
VYSALRWPGRVGALWRALIWVRSTGLLVLALQRVSHRYLLHRAQRGWSAETLVLRILIALARRSIAILTKCDVAELVDVGQGVYLSDRGFLILGPERIGGGTLIHERVTIGVRAGDPGRPVIGENVWIGPDCIIYGNVSVGNGATVLPGSVVSMNVPAGAVISGNPATIVRRGFDNTALRRTLGTDIVRPSMVLE